MGPADYPIEPEPYCTNSPRVFGRCAGPTPEAPVPGSTQGSGPCSPFAPRGGRVCRPKGAQCSGPSGDERGRAKCRRRSPWATRGREHPLAPIEPLCRYYPSGLPLSGAAPLPPTSGRRSPPARPRRYRRLRPGPWRHSHRKPRHKRRAPRANGPPRPPARVAPGRRPDPCRADRPMGLVDVCARRAGSVGLRRGPARSRGSSPFFRTHPPRAPPRHPRPGPAPCAGPCHPGPRPDPGTSPPRTAPRPLNLPVPDLARGPGGPRTGGAALIRRGTGGWGVGVG